MTINTIRLSTFHGGADNASWWPKKDEFAWFDEFRVSRTRINEWSKYALTTGLQYENELAQLSIFPNPSTSGEFSISQVANWEVYSNQGLNISSGNGTKIQLSNHPKGMYFLKVNGVLRKIVIQ